MPTNLQLNDELIREAMVWGKHTTKKAAVTAALEFYIELQTRQVHEARALKPNKKLNSGKLKSKR